MKPYSYKRIFARVIDMVVIFIISTALTYILPENREYKEAYEEYQNLLTEISQQEEVSNDLVTKTNDVIYNVSKSSVTTSVVTTVLTISYFVVFAYFMNGQTLGKKIMNIRIVSNSKKKLTMNNYLIRGLLVNSILMNTLNVIFVLGLNKNTYLQVNDITTYLFGAIYIVLIGMMLFREDGRGLHDVLAGTKVINEKELVEDNEEEKELVKNEDTKIKDAEIIKEKHV